MKQALSVLMTLFMSSTPITLQEWTDGYKAGEYTFQDYGIFAANWWKPDNSWLIVEGEWVQYVKGTVTRTTIITTIEELVGNLWKHVSTEVDVHTTIQHEPVKRRAREPVAPDTTTNRILGLIENDPNSPENVLLKALLVKSRHGNHLGL